MTIKELLGIRKALPADSKSGSVQSKYKIAKFLKETESDEAFYYAEMKKIIEECAVRDADDQIETDKDGNIPIKNEIKDTFYQKISELENTQIHAPDIYFTIDELEHFDLSANDLLAIDEIIKN